MSKKRKKQTNSPVGSSDIFRKEQDTPFFTKPEGLGEGRGLGASKGKMESALGENLDDVRIHTDSAADRLNRKQNSDAVTMGQDIAFGSGKFQPGTLAGDALMAHELAHTVQQKGAIPTENPISDRSPALERDANNSAVGVMGRLFGRGKGAKAKPGRKAGFSMQMSSCFGSDVAEPSRPDFFGPESHATMDAIETIDETWNMVSGLTLGGTLIILATSSPAENLASGSYDVEPQARALAAIPQIKIAQIRQQIDFLRIGDSWNGLSSEEKAFWNNLYNRLGDL